MIANDERYFGLDNFGNTCYCNSVIQALYFCLPFRQKLLEYVAGDSGISESDASSGSSESSSSVPPSPTTSTSSTSSSTAAAAAAAVVASPSSISHTNLASTTPITPNSNALDEDRNLLSSLADLFVHIYTQKKHTGSVAPKRFIHKLRKENELFRSLMQQDAHEFLNYLLNEITENLQNDYMAQHPGLRGRKPSTIRTLVHDLFEGTLTNETRCLTCDTVSHRDETFFDLSIDIEQNSSITACLRNFSQMELLMGENKFFCDCCQSLQAAQRRMHIKRLPTILILHLKRFKYIEHLQRHRKLNYRVSFPFELRVVNTCDSTVDPDREYELFGVVIHIGGGPNHGHFVSMIKSHGKWLLFDDDCVEPISDQRIQSVFGCASDFAGYSETGYMLFYQTRRIPTARPLPSATQQPQQTQQQSAPLEQTLTAPALTPPSPVSEDDDQPISQIPLLSAISLDSIDKPVSPTLTSLEQPPPTVESIDSATPSNQVEDGSASPAAVTDNILLNKRLSGGVSTLDLSDSHTLQTSDDCNTNSASPLVEKSELVPAQTLFSRTIGDSAEVVTPPT